MSPRVPNRSPLSTSTSLWILLVVRHAEAQTLDQLRLVRMSLRSGLQALTSPLSCARVESRATGFRAQRRYHRRRLLALVITHGANRAPRQLLDSSVPPILPRVLTRPPFRARVWTARCGTWARSRLTLPLLASGRSSPNAAKRTRRRVIWYPRAGVDSFAIFPAMLYPTL